jgi:hypothetical protein
MVRCPLAPTVNVALPPTATLTFVGCVVIAGGTITANAAGALVMEPNAFVITTE